MLRRSHSKEITREGDHVDHKVMVVTGASSGVGRELVLRFSQRSYTVCGLSRRTGKLEEVRRANPEHIEVYGCDVSNPADVEKTFESIRARHESIDVLVNNASIVQMKKFEEQDVGIIDRIIDTNLKGTMYVTHFALPAILKKQHAHIINIASVAGTRGIPKQALYCASKHGVVGFGDVLAQELIDRGVKVVTICPGAIRTPLWDSRTNPYPGDIGRIMEPAEIADLVDFILKQPEHTLYKKIILFPTNEWH